MNRAEKVQEMRDRLARVAEMIGDDEPTPTVRYCATCGEPEGSDYAKHCCHPDNLIED